MAISRYIYNAIYTNADNYGYPNRTNNAPNGVNGEDSYVLSLASGSKKVPTGATITNITFKAKMAIAPDRSFDMLLTNIYPIDSSSNIYGWALRANSSQPYTRFVYTSSDTTVTGIQNGNESLNTGVKIQQVVFHGNPNAVYDREGGVNPDFTAQQCYHNKATIPVAFIARRWVSSGGGRFRLCRPHDYYTTPHDFYTSSAPLAHEPTIECIIEWESPAKEPLPIFNFHFADAILTPTAQATLSWIQSQQEGGTTGLPDGAPNTLTKYTIYEYSEGDANARRSWSVNYTAPQQQYSLNFSAPVDEGVYTYKIHPYTDGPASTPSLAQYWPSRELTAELEVSLGSISAPSNFMIGTTLIATSAVDIHYGDQNRTSNLLTLSWRAPSIIIGPNNVLNYIVKYQRPTDAAPITLYTCTPENSVEGIYYYTPSLVYNNTEYWVEAQPIYGENIGTGKGRIFTHASQTQTTNFIIPDSFPVQTNSNISMAWNPISALSGNVKYQVALINDTLNTQTILATIEENTYIYDITSIISGLTFRIRVTPQIYYDSGTYVNENPLITSSIRRMGALSLNENFWCQYYDNTGGVTSGKNAYAYSNLVLQWENQVNGIQNTEQVEYAIMRKLDGTSFMQVGDKILAINGDANLPLIEWQDNFIGTSNCPENGTLDYKIVAYNQFGDYVESSIITVTKPTSPHIQDLQVTNVGYDELTFTFDVNASFLAGYQIKYKTKIEYGNSYYEYSPRLYDGGIIAPLDISYDSLILDLPILFSTIHDYHNPFEQAQLKVELYYDNLFGCQTQTTTLFNFNYAAQPVFASDASFFVACPLNYFNPKDVMSFHLTGVELDDEIAQGELIVSLIRSDYPTLQTNLIKAIDLPNYSCDLIAPQANEDTYLTFTPRVEVRYSNRSIAATLPNIGFSPITIPIARWTPEHIPVDGVILEKAGDDITLTGNIILPSRRCSSASLHNLSSVAATLIGASENYFLTEALNYVNNIMPFSIKKIDGAGTTSEIQFNIIFTNTSGKTISITTPPYKITDAEIDFAIRQGKIGVNVTKDFISNTADSTVEIHSGPQTNASPIVIIDGENTQGIFAELIGANDFNSQIKIVDNELVITNLHIPTSINNINELIETLQTTVSQHATLISQHTASVSTLGTTQAAHATAIEECAEAISALETDMQSLYTSTVANTNDITQINSVLAELPTSYYTAADAAIQINNAISAIPEGPHVYYSATQPSGASLKVGDIWLKPLS